MLVSASERTGEAMAKTLPLGVPELRYERLSLHLRHTFTIARSSEDVAESVILHLTADGTSALGESAPVGRYHETPALVEEQLRDVDLAGIDLFRLDAALGRVPANRRGAMCALDLALHDFVGKRLGVPVYQLFGFDPSAAKRTSFTIGIADLETMVAKTREAAHLPVLKIKVGAGREVETLEALRSVYTGIIHVDANEGWEPERAVAVLHAIERFGIEFCEQPVPAGDPAALRYVKEHSRIPIFADESCRTPDDIAPLAGCVDGIVIKLVKCGGLREAVKMIHTARSLGMKVMIGCMIESSILCTAGAHLTPVVDYADLDGPLLVTDDPYEGVRYEGAQLRLSDRPGLGIKRKTQA